MSRAATALVALVTTRLLTTTLGISGYGEYQIVVAYVSLFWILTDFGLNTLVVREMSQDEKNIQSRFSALLSIRFGFGLLLMAVAVLGLIWLPYSSVVKVAISIGVTTILFQALMGSATAIFQTKLNYKHQLAANILGSLSLLAGIYWVVLHGGTVINLSIVFVAGYLVMMLVSLNAVRQWVKLRFGKDFTLMKSLIIQTIPFGLSLLFSLATFKLDALLLSVLSLPITNETAVGIYNLAYKFFELAIVVPIFFMNVMYPLLNRLYVDKSTDFLPHTIRTGAVLLITGIIFGGVLYKLSPFLITILTNSNNLGDSVQVLQILALGLPVYYLTPYLMFLLLILHQQISLVYIYGIGLVFNIVLNWIYIPKYLYFAAAVTTGLTELLLIILLIFVTVRSISQTDWIKQHPRLGGLSD